MAKISIEKAKQRISSAINIQTYGSKSRVSINEETTEDEHDIEFLDSYGYETNDAIYIFKVDEKVFLTPSESNFKPIIGYFDSVETDDEDEIGSYKFKYDDFPDEIKLFFNFYAFEVESYQKENHDNDDINYGASQSFKNDWEFVGTVEGNTEYGLVPYYWDQGKGFYTGYESLANTPAVYSSKHYTHEHFPTNKFLWMRDYQNDWLASNGSKRYSSYITKKSLKNTNGDANFSFTYQSTADESLDYYNVYVGGTSSSNLWTKVDNFGTTETGNEVIITKNSSNVITVTFGDGTNGNIPSSSKTIYLRYKPTNLQYYGYSSTPNEYIKPITGCTTIATAMAIAYWGQYGVKIKRNGVEQIKKYKVGSKSVPVRTSIDKANNRWFFLEAPAVPEINEFDYDNIVPIYHIYYTKGTNSSASLHSDTKITHAININESNEINKYVFGANEDTLYNSSTNTLGVKQNLIYQRKAVADLCRSVNRILNSTCTPHFTGAFTQDAFAYLRNYIKFGKANVLPVNNAHVYYQYSSINDLLNSSGYSNGIVLGMKSSNFDSTIDSFEYAIYSELSKGIPVVFSGYGTSTSGDSAHSFICDGYKPETDQNIGDLWHFRFGWLGHGDGWFSMRIGNQINPTDHLYNNIRMILYRFYPNEYYNDYIDVNKKSVIFENIGGTDSLYISSINYVDNDVVENINGLNYGLGLCTKTSHETWDVYGYDFENSSNNPDWLTITKDQSNEGKLNISVTQNTGSLKQHTIRIYKTLDSAIYEDVTITLKGSDELPTYTLMADESTVIFENENANDDYYINVSSNIGWEIKYKDDSLDWLLTCEKTSAGKLKIKVAQNNTNEVKETYIILQTTDNDHSVTQTITIKINPTKSEYLQLESNKLIIEYNSETYIINVNTNVEYELSYDCDWLIANINNEDNIQINCTENNTNNNRSCIITINSVNASSNLTETLTVTQNKLNVSKYLELSTYNLSFTSDGGTKNVTVNTNVSDWTLSYDSDWVTHTINNNVITFNVNSNNTTSDKICNVTFSGSEIENVTMTIALSAKQVVTNQITLSKTNITSSYRGTNQQIDVTSENAWYVEEITLPNYIIITNNTQHIYVTVNEYNISSKRTYTLTVKDYFGNSVDFTLTLEPRSTSGYYLICENNYTVFEYIGGEDIISFDTNGTINYNIANSLTWISLTVIDNSIKVEVTENTTTSVKNGSFEVYLNEDSSQIITVYVQQYKMIDNDIDETILEKYDINKDGFADFKDLLVMIDRSMNRTVYI